MKGIHEQTCPSPMARTGAFFTKWTFLGVEWSEQL